MNELTRKNKITITIFLSVLFVVFSMVSYISYLYFTTAITHYFENLINNLPTILDFYILIVVFSFMLLALSKKTILGIKKFMRIPLFIALGTCLITLVINILVTSLSYGWISGLESSFHMHNYLQMGFETLIIVSSTLLLVLLNLSINNSKDNGVLENKIKVKTILYVLFMVTITASMTSFALMALPVYLDDYFDPNWYGIIPVLLMCLFPLAASILYLLNKTIFKTRKFWLKSLIGLAISLSLVFVWFIVCYIINPRFIYQSLQPLFPLGMSINLPIAPIISLIYLVVCLILSSVKYVRSKNEKEN